MARYFLDSSALVKRYHSESGSAEVETLFSTPGSKFFISRLALVEVQSSLARLVRERTLTEQHFGELVARLEDDVAAGILNVLAVDGRRLQGAARVLSSYGFTHNTRTLDAIHLTTAQALDGRSRLAGFVAADRKLLDAAANACGLPVLAIG